jgi:solute carrier family 13 (sodium-dependent dicarboxylate transporter), member 2/3/5
MCFRQVPAELLTAEHEPCYKSAKSKSIGDNDMTTAAPTQVSAHEQSSGIALRVNIGRVLCVVVPIIVWFAPLNIDAPARHGLAISSFMILAWITEAMEYALAGLIGCYLYWALRVAPFNVAFSGFATDTPWFLFGAILFGTMATKSGLARRMAFLVMGRVGNTYSRILLGLIITAAMLTFIVPSGVANVVIMAAVALGFIEAFGVGQGSNIGKGMFLIITYSAGLFDKMIIAGASSITARGIIERVGGVQVLWSRWFLAYLPCSIVTIFVAWRLVLWLFPAEKPALAGGDHYVRDEIRKLGSWTSLEKKAAFFILVAMVLWLTDTIHGIAPSMIGLGIGLAAVLPGLGVLTIDDMKRVNYLPVFFVAAALSMGEVLNQTKGLSLLTNFMFSWMEPLLTNSFMAAAVLYWTGFLYHFFLASEISMLATSMPLLMEFAKSHGFNPLQLGMMWSFAASGKIFVYQSGVMIVGYSYGYFQGKDLLRIGFYLSVIEAIILMLLVPFYWPLIGIR